MKVSFDPEKDEKTRRERGISLAIGGEIIRNRVSFGYAKGRLHVCVFTIRDEVFRVISVRKANDREVRKYGR